MTNKNRQTPNANQKIILHYIHSYQVMYSIWYILRSCEHEVLRYIQLNLNKLNITQVLYVSFTIVLGTENQRDLY